MHADEALNLYIALKLHFSSMSYDYDRFGGEIKNPVSVECRPDKLNFMKLAKKKDVFGRLVSNLIVNPRAHISSIIGKEGEDIYFAWKRRHESLKYHIKEEMEKLKEIFPEGFKVVQHQHPEAFKMYIRKDVSIEALAILNNFTNMFRAWDRDLRDDPVWVNMRIPLLKYGKWLHYDRQEMSKIVKEALL
jgi:hypothetical protein